VIAEGVDKGPFWVVGFFAELYIDVGESGWSFDVALGFRWQLRQGGWVLNDEISHYP